MKQKSRYLTNFKPPEIFSVVGTTGIMGNLFTLIVLCSSPSIRKKTVNMFLISQTSAGSALRCGSHRHCLGRCLDAGENLPRPYRSGSAHAKSSKFCFHKGKSAQRSGSLQRCCAYGRGSTLSQGLGNTPVGTPVGTLGHCPKLLTLTS